MIFALILAAYTNHAGVAVFATPVRVEAKHVTLSNATETVRYPFSIFPESEQRRIAADYSLLTGDRSALRIPADVRRAVDGNAKAVRRSRRRAEKGLCSEAESKDFIDRSRVALDAYLDKKTAEGRITPTERDCLAR